MGLTRAWEQRVHAGGQTLTLGLGGYAAVGISEARRQAAENVQKIKARHPRMSALDRLLAADVEAPGLGPDATAPVTIQQASPAPLFREVAEQYIEGQRPSWKQGSKTEKQTRSLLDRYVLLKVGDLPVDQVTSAHLLDLLSPIWHTRAESAKKVKRHLVAIMRLAEAKEHIDQDLLPKAVLGLTRQRNITRHSEAVPYGEVGQALDYVRNSKTFEHKKLALELLTATRTSEIRDMRRSELNAYSRTWTIPSERTKNAREHRIPLSRAAVVVLDRAFEVGGAYADGKLDSDDLVFTAENGGILSQDGFRQLLRRRYPKATPHGFRSTFRDWVTERTDYPAELAEHVLGHLEGSATIRAYARSDRFEQRRKLMADWAAFVTGEGNQFLETVIP